jgi:hypothetical protein
MAFIIQRLIQLATQFKGQLLTFYHRKRYVGAILHEITSSLNFTSIQQKPLYHHTRTITQSATTTPTLLAGKYGKENAAFK